MVQRLLVNKAAVVEVQSPMSRRAIADKDDAVPPKLPGSGRTASQHASTPPNVDTASMPGTSFSSAYALWKASDDEE